MSRAVGFLVLIALGFPALCCAQTKGAAQVGVTQSTSQARGAASTEAATPVPAVEPPSGGFAYNPEGRRDPFVSLLRRGGDVSSSSAARAPGLLGLGIGETTLKGILISPDGFVAMLQGADQKTYIVRASERLLDGSIRAITRNAVVFVQNVDDPLVREKQREVRKVLRQTEEAK
jgi:type IV pilus assembly protein PilP